MVGKKEKWYYKLIHDWHIWALLKGTLFGVVVIGIPIGTSFTQNLWRTYRLITNNAEYITIVMVMALVMGRMIGVARWPRTTPLDYNKITWPGMVSANFLSGVLGFILLILTIRLALPGFLEIIAAQISEKTNP